MNPTDKTKLEKKIAEGLPAFCPLCNSKLDIDKQDGTTGSRGYAYRCLTADCKFVPGVAYVPWYHVIFHAAQHKITQVFILIIGSVTVAGLAGTSFGFLHFGPTGATTQNVVPEQAAKEKDAKTTLDLAENTNLPDSLNRIITSLEDQIDSLQKRSNGPSAAESELIWYGKLSQGLQSEDRRKSKDYLFEVIEAYQDKDADLQLPEDEKNEIMEILTVGISSGLFSTEELDAFITKYVPVFSLRGRNYNHLAIAYYHLSQNDQSKRTTNLQKSLLNYLQYIAYLMDNSGNPVELKRVLPDVERIITSLRVRSALPKSWNRNTSEKITLAVDRKDRQEIEKLIADLGG